MVIESWPRLLTITNLPEECTVMRPHVFRFWGYAGGIVLMFCTNFITGFAALLPGAPRRA